MIFLLHRNARKFLKAIKDDEELLLDNKSLTGALWELAERFPKELIGWCEEKYVQEANLENWEEIFDHDLIMVSYAMENKFLPDSLGYIDQLPFIRVNRKLKYPTWQMSSDIGGIKGSVLFRFNTLFKKEKNFEVLLNSVGKIGQQNGLFCYSAPILTGQAELVEATPTASNLASPAEPVEAPSRHITFNSVRQAEPFEAKPTASKKQIFAFIYSHYKTVRLFLLFWCYIKYERSFPILPFLDAFFTKKKFKENIDLSDIRIDNHSSIGSNFSLDVIIPTLGRREMLLQVMEDLKMQSKLPAKVIVVEQNPDPESRSVLPELKEKPWPFEVIHHFTHEIGACRSRNLALEEVEGEYVFFADDDIRLKPDLFEKSLNEIQRLNVPCLNINCKQEGEATVFKKIKQWGSFGSGTSIVKADFCKKIQFDESFEYGFGEDMDYGMQLRNAGCDIIYHPELEILHLKAARGGFRNKPEQTWEKDQPKPSPTLMIFAKKYYTREQIKGFKTELFIRFYSKQKIKNPLHYFRSMQTRWKKSEEWAEKLIRRNSPVEKHKLTRS